MFVVGPAGSGRTTAVRSFLNRRAEQRKSPDDWCYVNNFANPRRPCAINLPAGRASQFRKGMEELVNTLKLELPRALEGEHHEQRRREIGLEFQRKQQELLESLDSYLNERGFTLIRSQAGLTIAPVQNGEPLTSEAYEKLDRETKKKYESFRPELQEQFEKTVRQTRELDRQARRTVEGITHEFTSFVIDSALQELRDAFQDCPKVQTYLEAVRQDVIENVSSFLPHEEPTSPLAAMARGSDKDALRRYRVNVLTETSDPSEQRAPVIIEHNPTYSNLMGRIEHQAQFGAMVTDFTQIRAGALHRANCGYLVIEAKDLLSNALSWEALKRSLRSHEIKIEESASFYGLVSTVSLEPEPIPLDVKIVIIGDEYLYQLLYAYDEDFRELFKVRSQFVTRMDLDQDTPNLYARFVGDLCRREGLKHFDPSAMARLLDEAAVQVEDQSRVTTRFADVADLVREASFWATHSGRDLVTAADVKRSVDERTLMRDHASRRYIETLQDGVVLIDTSGATVGQINALTVVQAADYEFGLPARITARTYAGKSGVISIDREVKMTGPIHDKGQIILASYLSSRFAQREPLSVSATLSFEQSYSGVEGDSASSTELYALLSSLSDIPIKQNLAVTGSVNQLGQVQAIGGVNAKIAGFYDVCAARGLTGDQGVMIPASNVRHLMLREDVVQAVAEGRFHIYAIATIEQGIELLTGTPAGEPDAEGKYPAGTLYAAVQAKLAEYSEAMRGEEEEEEEGPGRGTDDEDDSTNVDDEGEGEIDER
jgi:lon-related putative ATP-dependent protease